MNKPNFFLRAKHWQIFLILMVPVLIHMIIQFSLIPFGLDPETMDPIEIIPLFSRMMDIAIIFALLQIYVLFSWFWSVAITLNKKLSSEIVRKTWFFKLSIIILAIFYIGMLYQVSNIFSVLAETIKDDSLHPDIFTFIVPLFISLPIIFFCSIYVMGFVAKSIVMAENDEKVTLSEYIAEFFLIYFYPIGVWFLQPRINKLVSKDDD